MQLVRFEDVRGERRWGVRAGDGQVQPIAGDPFAGPVEPVGPAEPVARLLAPADPPNIIAIGANYAAHIRETGKKIPDRPTVFVKLTTSLNDPGGAIVLPAEAPHEVDFEAELAIVIGRACRNVAEADALEYVLGYACGNDVTARDCQFRLDGQWARAKSFDTFCPLGPWIETDLDPNALRIRSWVNGQLMQDSTTADMIFHPATLVSYLSRQFTLPAGTVIMTGTPEGVGFVRKPPVFLRDGDEVAVEIEGVGRLTNTVKR